MKTLAVLLLSLFCSVHLSADTANIAGASDLRYAFNEIQRLYHQKYPNEIVHFQFGSSGKLLTQIQNGAPYDAYFSADLNYPKRLKAQGLVSGDVKPYAIGRIGIMLHRSSNVSNPLAMLTNDRIKKIAIANPEHAPYGQAAVAALKKLGLYETIKHKLVIGENIQQATQYVQTGAADAGIIALSIAKTPDIREQMTFQLIDEKMHPQIIQGYALLKRGANNKASRAFIATVESPEGSLIMQKYGFSVQ